MHNSSVNSSKGMEEWQGGGDFFANLDKLWKITGTFKDIHIQAE